MARILRTYVIREIALPMLISLLTVTFLLVARNVYVLITIMMAPGVSVWQVARLASELLPSVSIFAFPMALLIGALIGVGRMTLDREILAMRASGINLFSVFAPALGLALVASAAIFWLSAGLVPRSMQAWMTQFNQMSLALANSLEPGRFYDDLPFLKSGGDVVFYFKERQPGTGAMLGIALEQANSVRVKRQASVANKASGQSTAGKDGKEGTSLAATSQTLSLQGGGMGQPGVAPANATRDEASSRVAQRAAAEPVSAARPAKAPVASKKRGASEKLTELILIFAQSGKFGIQRLGADDDPNAESEITLTLENGSIHHLVADPGKPDYAVIGYERLVKRRLYAAEIEKPSHAFDSETLRLKVGEQMRLPPDKRDKILGSLRKELWQRQSMWLATFVFALVGIPLAIWVRPSGKSWGIMIAIGLMLIYYVILQIGLSMVQAFSPAGIIVTLAPNALYALIGVFLWRQAVRS